MNLLSALVLGMKALNFSANQSLEEEKEVSPWTMGLTFTFASASASSSSFWSLFF